MQPDDDLQTRILDAAMEAASVHGISRMSVSDVAKRAGTSRPTLYKHFASKDALVAAVVLRETSLLVTTTLAAAEPFDDPQRAIEAGVLAALRLTRDHPLLDRVVRTEPEALVPLLVTEGSSSVMAIARAAVEQLIVAKVPDLSPLMARRLADLLTRLLISYALSAPDDPTEVVAASIAAFLTQGADGAQQPVEVALASLEDR